MGGLSLGDECGQHDESQAGPEEGWLFQAADARFEGPIARQEEGQVAVLHLDPPGYPLSTTSPVERAHIVSVPQPSTGRLCPLPSHSPWFSCESC